MSDYHVSFWSGDRAQVVGCDLKPEGERGLLDGFARAGRYALSLRRRSLVDPGEVYECGPTTAELLWLAILCGPAWAFVAASYWLGGSA